MSKTITGSYASGITLSSATDTNPVSVALGASIGNATGAALQGSVDTQWNITNAGTIAGSQAGILLPVVGQVSNSGAISATATAAGSGYHYDATSRTLTPLSAGVLLGGGFLTNLAGGAISGGFFGVALANTGSVTNLGSISASGAPFGAGVELSAGGYLDNTAGANITGSVDGVLALGNTGVTVLNAGQISGAKYGLFLQAASTLVNAGNIGSSGLHSYTVALKGGGAVVNQATGTIASSNDAVVLSANGTVTNQGSIASTHAYDFASTGFSFAGIDLQGGGLVTNAAGAHVSSQWKGVAIGTRTGSIGGTLVNSGSVFASDGTNGAAVWLHGTGLIDNEATGTIQGGPFGVVAYFDTTIVNRGAIVGTEFAVFQSSPTAANRVEVAPGASFSGLVAGGSTVASAVSGTLELLAGSGAGSIAGFGTQFVQFGEVLVDANATWSLDGTVAAGQTIAFGGAGIQLTLATPSADHGTLVNFNPGDSIVLPGVTHVTSAVVDSHEQLIVSTEFFPTLTFHLDPARHDVAGTQFAVQNQVGGSVLVACFAAGTRIATDSGEVAVETLAAGARVASPFGGSNEVVWVGQRHTDCRRHPRPQDVWPVRIAAGAFGPDRPLRDLWLSPDHAVFFAGVLIPARCLLNGSSIVQVECDAIIYHHVELARHDVLLADGLACETYLDTGNRAAFEGGGPALMLHPDFALQVWQAQACAEQVRGGERLAAVQRYLQIRAEQLGYKTSDETGLQVTPLRRRA
jgi:Hint domain